MSFSLEELIRGMEQPDTYGEYSDEELQRAMDEAQSNGTSDFFVDVAQHFLKYGPSNYFVDCCVFHTAAKIPNVAQRDFIKELNAALETENSVYLISSSTSQGHTLIGARHGSTGNAIVIDTTRPLPTYTHEGCCAMNAIFRRSNRGCAELLMLWLASLHVTLAGDCVPVLPPSRPTLSRTDMLKYVTQLRAAVENTHRVITSLLEVINAELRSLINRDDMHESVKVKTAISPYLKSIIAAKSMHAAVDKDAEAQFAVLAQLYHQVLNKIDSQKA